MKTNMPILYANIMDGMKSQIGLDAFLWATDRPGNDRMCYAAERFAHDVESLVEKMTPMLDAAARIRAAGICANKPMLLDGERYDQSVTHDPDLMRFLLLRHANWRYGGNVHPSYCEADA